MLELQQLPRRLGHEGLDGVLVAQPVAAGDGVVGVFVQGVVFASDAGRAALGRNRVAAHRVHLGDDRHAQVRISLRYRDCGAQTRAAAADHDDVMGGCH